MRPVYIAPSILAADFTRLGEQVKDAEAAGGGWIHIDVMDGRFVPNITFGPLVIEAVRRSTTLPLDVHLMIVEPDHYLEAFARAGADHITVHVEACPHLHRTLQAIHALGCRAGVALNPHTPALFISEILHLADIVLVMTVNPGYGGQAFLPETMSKVKQVAEMCAARGHEVDIVVDGGVDIQTAGICVESGANVLVAGSALFNKNHSVADKMTALRQVIGQKES